MGVKTWLDRITDETNLWLTAVKVEEGKDFSGAAVLYLRDASSNLKETTGVRSALSCACAAECLAKAGAIPQAKDLYFEAGLMYGEVAEAKVSYSIRETLWALQRAYECFVLAEDAKGTQATHEALSLLARRVNPFVVGTEGFQPPRVASRSRLNSRSVEAQPVGSKVQEAVDGFKALRRGRNPAKEGKGRAPPRRIREESDAEESIVSQLG
jgi:hypothetical protein